MLESSSVDLEYRSIQPASLELSPPRNRQTRRRAWRLRCRPDRRHGNGAAHAPGLDRRGRGGSASPEVPAFDLLGGCCRSSQSRHGNGSVRSPRPEGWERGRGMRARKSPPPACGAVARATAAAGEDLKPFSGGGGRGCARFFFLRISLLSPYSRVLGWNSVWGGGRPAGAGSFGAGRRPAGPGPVLKAWGARAAFGGSRCRPLCLHLQSEGRPRHRLRKFWVKFDKRPTRSRSRTSGFAAWERKSVCRTRQGSSLASRASQAALPHRPPPIPPVRLLPSLGRAGVGGDFWTTHAGVVTFLPKQDQRLRT